MEEIWVLLLTVPPLLHENDLRRIDDVLIDHLLLRAVPFLISRFDLRVKSLLLLLFLFLL
jgi:hypothetical protein